MKYLNIFMITFLSACGITSDKDNLNNQKCCPNLSTYVNFNYEFANKKILNIFSEDTIYDADVIINISRKDSAEFYYVDSILCYCLAICKNENLTRVRFYDDVKGYEIAKKYKINNFSSDSILSKYYGNITWITEHLIASFNISNKADDWRNQVNSDFLVTPYPRKIMTKWNSEKAKRLIIEN